MATRNYSMTQAARESRRRNARNSTGPRTAEGKRRAAQNGFHSAALRPARAPAPGPSLPGGAEKLTRELAQAFQPANSAERLLVEELAALHFRKRGNQEAQTGLIQKNWCKLARERAERQREMTLEGSDYPAPMAVAAGYFTMEDCPAKFRQLSRLLNVMKQDVELWNFSREGEKLLRALYGPCPSMRGGGILGSYRTLLESGYAPRPAAPAGPTPVSTDGGSAPVPAVQESEESQSARLDRLSLEATREELLRALEEEKSLLAAKFQAYLDEHFPSPDAMQRAAFVPVDEAWGTLIHQDQSLDRQIESKTRLLLFMQWVRRKERDRASLYREVGKAKKS